MYDVAAMVLSRDTTPEIEAMQIAHYRSMTPAQKLRRVEELRQAADTMAAARLRRTYGEMSARELQLRLAALRLGRETMVEVFDWDPDERGW
jgi:hypothetical protein